MTDREIQDLSYNVANGSAFGEALAAIFRGLVQGGLKREEALVIVTEYAYGLAVRPKGEEEER